MLLFTAMDRSEAIAMDVDGDDTDYEYEYDPIETEVCEVAAYNTLGANQSYIDSLYQPRAILS